MENFEDSEIESLFLWNENLIQNDDFFKDNLSFLDQTFFNDLSSNQSIKTEETFQKKDLFTTNQLSKMNSTTQRRRDYYIKKMKVNAIGKYLIKEINKKLKEKYHIKKKMKKPSQTFIKETSILLNRQWLTFSVETLLTYDFNEYYTSKKNPQCSNKIENNKKIFSLLNSKRHRKEFTEDSMFKRTVKDILVDYLHSEQFEEDKLKEGKSQDVYEDFLKGNKERNQLNMIEYLLYTKSNKSKLQKYIINDSLIS